MKLPSVATSTAILLAALWILSGCTDKEITSVDIARRNLPTPIWVYLAYASAIPLLALLIYGIIRFKRFGYVWIPLPRYTWREIAVGLGIGIFLFALINIKALLSNAATLFGALLPGTNTILIAASIIAVIGFVFYVVMLGRELAQPTTPSAGSIFVMFVLSLLVPIVGLGLACCALSSSENRHLGIPFLMTSMFAIAVYLAWSFLGGAFTGAN